jgi:formylglycine-generating enzyme required for sulfatase activity
LFSTARSGRYLVTFDLFDAYCEAQGLPRPADIEGNRGAYPVINVTWLEVTRFCNWKSRKEGLSEAFNDEVRFPEAALRTLWF